MIARLGLRVIALAYVGVLVAAPVGIMLWSTFSGGLGPVAEALTRPTFLSALMLTLTIVAIAVPLNTVFGVLFALVVVRQSFRGKAVLGALLDLPLGVSPVIVGLALVVVYGRRASWEAGWPSMASASSFRRLAWSWPRCSSACPSWRGK